VRAQSCQGSHIFFASQKSIVKASSTTSVFCHGFCPRAFQKTVFQDPLLRARSQEVSTGGSFLWHDENETNFPDRSVFAGVWARPCGTEFVQEINPADLPSTLLSCDSVQLLYGETLVAIQLAVKLFHMKCQVLPSRVTNCALGGQEDAALLSAGVEPTRLDPHGAKPQQINYYMNFPRPARISRADIIGVIHSAAPQCHPLPSCLPGHLFEMPRARTVLRCVPQE